MIYLADLLAATGARPPTRDLPERFSRFCSDADAPSQGDLYVALNGDGQLHARKALQAGASAALCENWTGSPHAAVLIVPDSRSAIRMYAEFAIQNFGTKIVGIGGRSRRDASITRLLSETLSTRFDVFRHADPITDSSAIWLSIGAMHPGHDVALFDFSGCSRELVEEFTTVIPPDVGLLLPDLENGSNDNESGVVSRAIKAILAAPVRPDGQIVVSETETSAYSPRDRNSTNLFTFGIETDSRVAATEIRHSGDFIEFKLRMNGCYAASRLLTQISSDLNSAVTAAAVAAAFGLAVEDVAGAISETRPETDAVSADEGSAKPVNKIVTLNSDGPVWLDIDLEAVESNVRRISAVVGPGVKIIAVIKADGYGHGARRIAKAALQGGASRLAVSRLSEAQNVRDARIAAPILVLGHTRPADARWAVNADCELTVFDRKGVLSLQQAAASFGKKLAVHLKIDTGMGRLGAMPADAPGLAQLIASSDSLELVGVMTHLGRSGEADKSHAMGQLAEFDRALAEIRSAGIDPGIVHAANTAAAMHIPESRYDMVRCGIAIYGLDPSLESPLPEGFSPAVTMSARVAQVKRLPKGTFVGYGYTGKLERDSIIAVVGAGYGDGFRRGPTNWGPVLVRGCEASVVGRVCMEMFMIDVTEIRGVKQGDQVVLIGTQGGKTISAFEAARRAGTISYEIITQMLPHVRDG